MAREDHPSSSPTGRPGSGAGAGTLSAILVAAAEIASLEGLEQLSMRRLAAAVGMSKSGLYAHFASKDELQLATIDHVVRVFRVEVLEEPPDRSVGERPALLERWLAFFERRVFAGGCFLIVSAVEFSGRPGRVRDALAAAVEAEIEVLETAILRAQRTGEVRAEADAGQTAFELHAILMNTHALFQIKRDPAVFDRARTAMARLVGDLGS